MLLLTIHSLIFSVDSYGNGLPPAASLISESIKIVCSLPLLVINKARASSLNPKSK